MDRTSIHSLTQTRLPDMREGCKSLFSLHYVSIQYLLQTPIPLSSQSTTLHPPPFTPPRATIFLHNIVVLPTSHTHQPLLLILAVSNKMAVPKRFNTAIDPFQTVCHKTTVPLSGEKDEQSRDEPTQIEPKLIISSRINPTCMYNLLLNYI